TLLVEKYTLAAALVVIAALAIYFNRRQIKRKQSILVRIIFLCVVCIAIQLIAVPFAFKHILKLYQVERIYSTVGKEVPNEYVVAHANETEKKAETKKDPGYNVRQSKIAIGSGRV